MIQYLVIHIDETSPSFCHCQNPKKKSKLISLEDLKSAIFFAMKENLMIQYVLPEYELPSRYKEVMNSIDSHLIVPSTCQDKNAAEAADVIVFDRWIDLEYWDFDEAQSYVLRTTKKDFFEMHQILTVVFERALRIIVVFTDVDSFTEADFDTYKHTLEILSTSIAKEYAKGHYVQLNLLTDRMMLTEMKNCGAGDSNITLAPDGKFYVCPGFYYDGVCDGTEASLGDVCQKGYAIGSLQEGLDIKNQHLYIIENAPLCRHCDAYQCKRCIWLNHRTTLEVNIPSHEQCVMAHIERNAARKLLADIKKMDNFMLEQEIKEIDYLDPFDVRKEW